MVFLIRLFAFALLLLLGGCTSLLFQPMQIQLRTPADVGVAYRDVYFPAADGTTLHGWFLPAQGAAKGTVLFLHGNAENISTHLGSVWWLPAHGYQVFLYDYRGYGFSDGKPSLEGLLSDYDGAFDRLLRIEEAQGKPIAVFGQSLGGAVAIAAVARSPHQQQVATLVVEGAFSDYRKIAREKLGEFWLTWPLQWPLSFTVDNSYRPLSEIRNIEQVPLLIVGDGADTIIPRHHATDLYAAANSPKLYWEIEGAPHIGAFATPPSSSASSTISIPPCTPRQPADRS